MDLSLPVYTTAQTITRRSFLDGVAIRFTFLNGRGASVVKHAGSYGSDADLWELAVLDADGNLDYSTDITGDVLGWLEVEEVQAILERIMLLPAPTRALEGEVLPRAIEA